MVWKFYEPVASYYCVHRRKDAGVLDMSFAVFSDDNVDKILVSLLRSAVGLLPTTFASSCTVLYLEQNTLGGGPGVELYLAGRTDFWRAAVQW